jgi:carbon storage regulator CsrA
MLVLKRHRGEVIMIGESQVKVLQISEEWVELGISAPPDCQIIWPGKNQAPRADAADALNSA